MKRGVADRATWVALGIPSIAMTYPFLLYILEWLLHGINAAVGTHAARPSVPVSLPDASIEGMLLAMFYLGYLVWISAVVMFLGWRRGAPWFIATGIITVVITLFFSAGFPPGWPFLALGGAFIYGGRRMLRLTKQKPSGLPEI